MVYKILHHETAFQHILLGKTESMAIKDHDYTVTSFADIFCPENRRNIDRCWHYDTQLYTHGCWIVVWCWINNISDKNRKKKKIKQMAILQKTENC